MKKICQLLLYEEIQNLNLKFARYQSHPWTNPEGGSDSSATGRRGGPPSPPMMISTLSPRYLSRRAVTFLSVGPVRGCGPSLGDVSSLSIYLSFLSLPAVVRYAYVGDPVVVVGRRRCPRVRNFVIG